MTRVGAVAAIGAVALSVVSLAGWLPETGSKETAVALDGRMLFQAKGCAACHTGPDSQGNGGAFPPLDDAAAWAGTRRAGLGSADYLAESMRDPSAFIPPAFTPPGGPGGAMPELALDDAEIEAIVEYLLTP